MPVIQALKSCPLFSGYHEPGLLMMAKISRHRPVTAQTPIFVESMAAESMYIVKNGIVQLSVRSADGRDVVLDQLAPGEFFGEISLLIGGHRMVTATAKTDCELIEIMRRDFIKLQNQKPQVCLKLVIAIINQFSKKLTGCREHLRTLMVAGFPGIDT
jgi:CRP-like cAMP-binding protein